MSARRFARSRRSGSVGDIFAALVGAVIVGPAAVIALLGVLAEFCEWADKVIDSLLGDKRGPWL